MQRCTYIFVVLQALIAHQYVRLCDSTLVYIYIFSFLELDRRIPNLCAYTVADAYDILKRLMLLNYHKNYNCANDKST